MKKYIMSFADSTSHKPDHPERTARRAMKGVLNFDVQFCVWPSRGAMLKTCEMQCKREHRQDDWRPCQP